MAFSLLLAYNHLLTQNGTAFLAFKIEKKANVIQPQKAWIAFKKR